MTRSVITAVALAGMLALGCEKKDNGTPPEVQNTADKAGSEAANALGKVKSNVSDATDKAKENADNMTNSAAKDNMKNGADAVQSSIDDIISKAKDAVKNQKWDDAENYLGQIKDLKSKLPESAQPKVDASVAEVQKLIDTGKSLVPSK